jgi:hypothetical protein
MMMMMMCACVCACMRATGEAEESTGDWWRCQLFLVPHHTHTHTHTHILREDEHDKAHLQCALWDGSDVTRCHIRNLLDFILWSHMDRGREGVWSTLRRRDDSDTRISFSSTPNPPYPVQKKHVCGI